MGVTPQPDVLGSSVGKSVAWKAVRVPPEAAIPNFPLKNNCFEQVVLYCFVLMSVVLCCLALSFYG